MSKLTSQAMIMGLSTFNDFAVVQYFLVGFNDCKRQFAMMLLMTGSVAWGSSMMVSDTEATAFLRQW